MEEPKKPKLRFISSWDDGDPLDLKVSRLLLEHNLPGIFYLPSISAFSDSVKALAGNGFEIGGHTVSHPQDLKLLSDNDLDYQIMSNKDDLETVLGKPITKFCYPRGRYDDRVIDSVKRAGYLEARTTEVLQTHFVDPFRKGTTIHVYPRNEYQGKDWVEVAKTCAEFAKLSEGTFHIWGHSWEVEKLGLWTELDNFFEWLSKNYQIINN